LSVASHCCFSQNDNANVVRSSVGAGLTWAPPFGALTVNYAVPLTKALTTSSNRSASPRRRFDRRQYPAAG